MNGITRAITIVICAIAMVGCGETSSETIDDSPIKLDGARSTEFEQDDIDRAEDASEAVKDYCADAVSEAQRLGCESHVTEDDIP